MRTLLENNSFFENSAESRGGAIFATNCMGNGIVVTNCVFRNCSANVGGTIVLENSNIILDASELKDI